MKATKNLILAIVLVGLLSSCHTSEREGQGTDLSAIKWEIVEAHKTYLHPDVAQISEESDTAASFRADIVLTFPQLGSKASGSAKTFTDSVSILLMKRLIPEDSLLGSTPKETLDRFVQFRQDAYLEDFEAAKAEGYSTELLSGFVDEILMTDSVAYNDHNLFSIQTFTYEYTGGAHGRQSSKALTFDFSKEKLLTADDLFRKGATTKIDSLIRQELFTRYHASSGEELEELGFFNYAEAKTTDNMLLTRNGVTFIFDPYEIAAYFLGTIQVELPYSALSPYLSEDYAFLAK